MLAYSTGVLLSFVVLCRNTADSALMWQRHLEATDGQLMVGIEFPDGRRCSNLGGTDVELDDDVPRLVDRGGGGGGQSYEFTYWLTPLPPSGTLKLVCRCTAVGVEETVTELDSAPLLDAAVRAEVLWPWTPPDEHPPEPRALDLPEDSWFRRPR